MTVKIKPKRGSGAPATSDLDTNEIAMDMAAGKIYVDNGSAVVVLAEANQTADIDLSGSLSVPAIDGGTGADKTIDIDVTEVIQQPEVYKFVVDQELVDHPDPLFKLTQTQDMMPSIVVMIEFIYSMNQTQHSFS